MRRQVNVGVPCGRFQRLAGELHTLSSGWRRVPASVRAGGVAVVAVEWLL